MFVGGVRGLRRELSVIGYRHFVVLTPAVGHPRVTRRADFEAELVGIFLFIELHQQREELVR
jgi:hypothetical protein